MDEKAQIAWVMFYTAVMGWQWHPGNMKNDNQLSFEQCADAADAMLNEYLKRRKTWDGWPRQQ